MIVTMKFGLIFLSCLIVSQLSANDLNSKEKPVVGKPIHDYTFTNIRNYHKNEISINEFRGKWLILDLWSIGCTSCIQSFPKINQLQLEFKENIQFILVGRLYKNIVEVFDKIQQRQQLTVVTAFDSVLFNKWGVTSVPHIVIIDPTGIVKAITKTEDLTNARLKNLVAGNEVTFFEKDNYLNQPEFDPESFIDKDQLIYQSILVKSQGEKIYTGYYPIDFVTLGDQYKKKGYRQSGVPLIWLYKAAYLGKFTFTDYNAADYGTIAINPILELYDSSDFIDSRTDSRILYNYYLHLPLHAYTLENLMTCLQQDLTRSFSYKAAVEKRMLPVWLVVAKPKASKKIRTKGGTRYSTASEGSITAGFKATNIPMKSFMNLLFSHQFSYTRYPIFDITGITENIDVEINADLTNMEDIKRELNRLDLDLILGKREMKVLVIRDK